MAYINRKLNKKLHIRQLNGYIDFATDFQIIAVPNVKNRLNSRKKPGYSCEKEFSLGHNSRRTSKNNVTVYLSYYYM
jgi:hypothetical protein